jgi:tetratricopeptide (TPR) repeat protein
MYKKIHYGAIGRVLGLVILMPMLLFSCKQEKKPKGDAAQNAYYFKYVKIYRGYGKVPLDTTKIKLEEYIREFPNDAKSRYFLGLVHYKKGDLDSAVSISKSALSLSPKYTSLYVAIGAYYISLEKQDSALFYLQKAIDMGDTTGLAYSNLALVYSKNGQKDKFRFYADSALHYYEYPALVNASLSWGFHQIKDNGKAEEYFAAAADAGLKDTALLRLLLNEKISATEYFRKADF